MTSSPSKSWHIPPILTNMRSIVTVTLLFIFLDLFCQERYISIDRQKFRIKELGAVGSPAVIFESGQSDSLEVWGSIPDSVASFAHVFLYDRADIGKSDTSSEERTIPNLVAELRRILKQENINPPYILAGHSMGGFIIRYFSSQFPDEVKGLLLLDPTPEAYWNSLSKKDRKRFLEYGDKLNIAKHPPRQRKEWYMFVPNLVYMQNLYISKDLPVILISASESKLYKFQDEIISGFKNAKHIELKGGHYIHRAYPDLTVKYIRDLIYLSDN
jgi:hypothetical protein